MQYSIFYVQSRIIDDVLSNAKLGNASQRMAWRSTFFQGDAQQRSEERCVAHLHFSMRHLSAQQLAARYPANLGHSLLYATMRCFTLHGPTWHGPRSLRSALQYIAQRRKALRRKAPRTITLINGAVRRPAWVRISLHDVALKGKA